jgi:hypothetical protein
MQRMIKQYILHRILQEEIEAFHRIGIKPNTVVMSQNILGHMEQWKDFLRYYTPAEQSSDFRAKYCGLTLVQATASIQTTQQLLLENVSYAALHRQEN